METLMRSSVRGLECPSNIASFSHRRQVNSRTIIPNPVRASLARSFTSQGNNSEHPPLGLRPRPLSQQRACRWPELPHHKLQRALESHAAAASTSSNAAWTSSNNPEGATPTLPPDSAPSSPTDEPEKLSLIGSLLKHLRSAWVRGVLLPLASIGAALRRASEGGVGLFLLSGVLLFGLIVVWIKGIRASTQSTRYHAVFHFSQASGMAVGTPVRIRGVGVGSVIGLRPSLARVDAVVEITDDRVVIPRNSLIEVNQTGLVSETLIDITPQLPLPQPTVGPTHPRCREEGLIVCDRDSVDGVRGICLDELVGLCTRVIQEIDNEGVGPMFQTLQRLASLAEEARPLVEKASAMATDLSPVLSGLKDGELLRNLERLSGVALEAARDIKRLNSTVLSDGKSTAQLREAVTTLTKTLKNVETISSDMSSMTGDPNTKRHLKAVMEALSRIVVD